MEEVGYVIPTEVQLQALPFLYSGRDCVLHAQVYLWDIASSVVLVETGLRNS